MKPRYIVSIEDYSLAGVREEVALTEGVEPLWSTDIFDQLVVELTSGESDVVADAIQEIDGVSDVTAERVGHQNEMVIDNPESFVATPDFDLEEETQRVVDEEIESVRIQENHHVFEDITVEYFDYQKIAVVDSGIDVRNPTVTNVVERINLTDDQTYDSIGHGTVMACILNVQRPNIDLVDIKVLDDRSIRETDVIRALAIATEPKREIDGVSMSLGFEPRDGYCPLCEAVNRTVYTGVAVSASSGQHAHPREDPLPPMCPARAEEALAVTATSDREDDGWFAEGDIEIASDWSIRYHDD